MKNNDPCCPWGPVGSRWFYDGSTYTVVEVKGTMTWLVHANPGHVDSAKYYAVKYAPVGFEQDEACDPVTGLHYANQPVGILP